MLNEAPQSARKTLCERESGRKIRSKFEEFLQVGPEAGNTIVWPQFYGANVALVSRCPQATASTLVGFCTPLCVVEAETPGHWSVTAQPPIPRSPACHLARLSGPAMVTEMIKQWVS